MTFAAAGAASSSKLSVGAMTRLERPLSQGSIPRSSGPLQGHSTSPPARPKSASSGKRPPSTPPRCIRDDSTVSGRVRVAVRLRPRNDEERVADADFADCVELESELKRLKLRRNNWSSETFQFDEVFTENASQKRVYEVVAKPVVESVLNGYNGTVMAYGQTGTGKTFTLGQMGKEDSADRGIMVRAIEDILAELSPDHDTVAVSYLQLYMETVQDLLAPEKDNIPIIEDPKNGDVSLPGATTVQVHDHNSFVRLLQTGEVNRFAANTKLNTESSRSHAVLLVYVKRSTKEKNENKFPLLNENGSSIQISKGNHMPTIRRSKLLIVDLAGSERIDKSGSEGHTLDEAKSINLSLTALGKCINALAENSPHIPTRDSKLTRLLRDSFGGAARTSLVITIGPSPRHRGETASTIMFGQRAMKVENMVKLKEEFDYKSLCRKLENQVDMLTAENERQSKLALDIEQKMERKLRAAQWSLMEAESKLATNIEVTTIEKIRFQKEFKDIVCKLEQEHGHRERMEKALEHLRLISEEKEKVLQNERQKHQDELFKMSQLHQQEILEIKQKLEIESAEKEGLDKELKSVNQVVCDQHEKIEQLEMENDMHQEKLADMTQIHQKEVSECVQMLDAERVQCQHMEKQLKTLEQAISQQNQIIESQDQSEILELRKRLEEQCQHQGNMEKELQALQIEKGESSIVKVQLNEEAQNMRQKLKEEQKQREKLEEEVKTLKQQLLQLSYETRKNLNKESSVRVPTGSESPMSLFKSTPMRDTISGQKATIAKIFEEVGLHKILSLLESEDMDVRIHAVKVVANLAAEEVNQEKIVEAGGLASLLILLETSEDETVQRVAAGAIANLGMNETNQELIMNQGGIRLLAKIANKAEDPQTLRMVAGAIANLCGNDKLQMRLRDEGGIKALLGMVKSRHSDVLAQVARGVANFAKCESRGTIQGHKISRSLLIDDGALPWIVANSNSEAAPTRRHIELALCHLAQHEANARDLVACGALRELVRISRESSREDIRNLAKRILNSSALFQTELRRMNLPHE